MMNALLSLALLLAAAPASALFVDGGLTQTFGSDKYVGTRAYADLGGDFHIKPSYSMYHSDLSNGTWKTLAARLGYDNKLFGAGVTAGGTPKVNGYSNSFFGADLTFSLTPGFSRNVRRIPGSHETGGPRGKGLARVDVGGAVVHTTHRDDWQLPTGRPYLAYRGSRSGPLLSARGATTALGQTDVSVNAGVSILGILLSAEGTASRYDKDLAALSAAPAAAVGLTGLTSTIQGFPKRTANARVEFSMLPFVMPYASITRTNFHLGQPSATAVTVGASVGLEMLEVHGAFEHYNPGAGAPAKTFTNFGAGLRF